MFNNWFMLYFRVEGLQVDRKISIRVGLMLDVNMSVFNSRMGNSTLQIWTAYFLFVQYRHFQFVSICFFQQTVFVFSSTIEAVNNTPQCSCKDIWWPLKTDISSIKKQGIWIPQGRSPQSSACFALWFEDTRDFKMYPDMRRSALYLRPKVQNSNLTFV